MVLVLRHSIENQSKGNFNWINNNKIIVNNNQVHSRNTGYVKLNLICPKYICETEGGKAFLVRACKLWNALSLELRSRGSLPAFKKSLFTVILKEQLI